MREQDIKDLGFEKRVVSPEESGYDTEFYYYNYDFGRGFSLISPSNDEVETDWWIEVFEEPGIRIYDAGDLRQLVEIILRNKIDS